MRYPYTIENGAGERLTFFRMVAGARGDRVEGETLVSPGSGPPMHVHHLQDEGLTVLQGRLGYQRLGSEPEYALAGETVVFRAGEAHRFWNAGEEEAHFVCEIRPALRFEQLIETMFGLASDGKTNRKGMPNPLRLAVIADAHFDTVRLPFPPALLQRVGLALGAPVGRLLGYEATYAPSGAAPAAAVV